MALYKHYLHTHFYHIVTVLNRAVFLNRLSLNSSPCKLGTDRGKLIFTQLSWMYAYTRFEVLTLVKVYSVVFWVVTPCSLIRDTNFGEEHTAFKFRAASKTLKMEAVCSSETLVSSCQTIRCHNPEDNNIWNFSVSTTPNFTEIISRTKNDDGQK
jgi:hypothetical protein